MGYAEYTLETDDRPRFGLIVLRADETIEDEFRQLLDPQTARLSITRIPSAPELTPDTILKMETALPAAAALFPEGARFDAVGYACTSGSSLIGPDRVADLVRSQCDCAQVTNPLTAAFAALHSLKASRIGIISPYTDDIAQKMQSDFEAAGFEVARTLSFGEKSEALVARIGSASIIRAVQDLVGDLPLDAVFLSCTNLRTLAAIAHLNGTMNIPVISSNLALAWHMTGQVELRRALAIK